MPSDPRPQTGIAQIALIVGLSLLAAFYAVVILALLAGLKNGVTRGGAPLFFDFATFWQAGRFAIEGQASRAYDDAAMIAAELAAFSGSTTRLPWNYPPTFQLLMMPFAAMPYMAGFIAYSVAGFGALMLAARRHTPELPLALVVLAPALFVNLFIGQNGLISLSLLVLGVGLLKHRPVLAGVCLGLLAFKPQLALGVPIALIACGAWRALAAAAASQAVLGTVSALALGLDSWRAFVMKVVHPAAIVSRSSSSWDTVPSLGVLARQLGAPATLANLVQLAGALIAAVMLARFWRRHDDPLALMAVLGAASLLIAPYLRPYDLILLLPLTALVWRDGPQAGWALKTAGIVGWLLPALLAFTIPPLQYGALVSLLGLIGVVNHPGLRQAQAV